MCTYVYTQGFRVAWGIYRYNGKQNGSYNVEFRVLWGYMGCSQNSAPLLVLACITAPNIEGYQEGPNVGKYQYELYTHHIYVYVSIELPGFESWQFGGPRGGHIRS